MALKENYFSFVSYLYAFLNKDFKYTPYTRQQQEMANAKRILEKITKLRLIEICKYVNEYRPEWRTVSQIYSHLDDLIVLTTKYSKDFELDEGYKYNNKTEKTKVYKEWRKLNENL